MKKNNKIKEIQVLEDKRRRRKMSAIMMALKYVIPRFGMPSLSKPICVGYKWVSGLVELNNALWIYISLSLEDYGRFSPRFLQVAISFIPKDKDIREKISQHCYSPDYEDHLYGITILYDLGLFHREKRLGIIELRDGEQKASFVPYSKQESLRSLFVNLIGREFLAEDFVILGQLDRSTCDDARFVQSKKLALKRLKRKGKFCLKKTKKGESHVNLSFK